MKIFLTGGTGFIGSNFLDLALKKNYSITAIKRKDSQPSIALEKIPNWKTGEMSNDWSKELKKCSIFIHMASCGVIDNCDDWEKCFEVNVNQSINLWRQAIRCGIRQFIIIGSCSEYGKNGNNYTKIPVNSSLIPTNAYAASKAAATMAAIALAIEHNLDLKILRLFHVFGKGEDSRRFWKQLKKAASRNEDFEMTKGEQVRDFSNVEEISKKILSFLSLKGEFGNPSIFNIGSGKPQKLVDFANSEWESIGATGKIIVGAKKYRKNEIMSYVPKL